MNNDLLNYIKSLTHDDKKTLSQKVVKTMEEVGELSREVLPLENATGTLHRLTTKDGALEEIVDSILCLLSIGYDLGVTNEELEKMMWRKAEYWNQLQVKESGVKFPLPYEIHITVNSKDWDYFKDVCALAGVKPLSLDLLDRDGKVVQTELMTVSKFIGNNADAADEMNRIKSVLKTKGFSIDREKIETVPWHPAALKSNIADGDAYFECHFNVTLSEPREIEDLLFKCHYHGIALSINNHKNYDKTRYLLTVRHKNKVFVQNKSETLKKEMVRYNPHDFMLEYAIYDTNVSQDSSWINS